MNFLKSAITGELLVVKTSNWYQTIPETIPHQTDSSSRSGFWIRMEDMTKIDVQWVFATNYRWIWMKLGEMIACETRTKQLYFREDMELDPDPDIF